MPVTSSATGLAGCFRSNNVLELLLHSKLAVLLKNEPLFENSRLTSCEVGGRFRYTIISLK